MSLNVGKTILKYAQFFNNSKNNDKIKLYLKKSLI